jgi:16S rRNA (cytosine1402-N4)-methyltransferase
LQTIDLLDVGGKLSVISYHSLEDRLVKRIIQKGRFDQEPEKDFYGNVYLPFKKDGKLIIPSYEEIKQNNRARSAKLRIAIRN